jgi:hypothetical protein
MTMDQEKIAAALTSPEGRRQVAELTAANEISRRGDEIYDQAVKEIGQAKVDKALGNFQAFDGLRPELAEVIFDAVGAHKLLYEIGKDPDLIDRLYKMSPTKMIAEVTRMGERLGGSAKRASGGDAAGGDWRDPETSMSDFVKGREADLAAKRKAQRDGIRVY